MPSPSPSPRTPSRWSGLSPEQRRRERRQLLVEAAFDLLATGGSTATTVRAVCARARLNPRYFYESFDELDALVVAVYDWVIEQLRAAVREAVRDARSLSDDPRDSVRATVAATVRFVDDDRRRGRVLYVEALGNEALDMRRMQTGFDLVELVQRGTTRRGAGSGSEQLDRVGAAMLVGGFSEILAAWLDGRIAMEADELIESATTLFVAVGEAASDVAGHAVR